MDRHALGPTRSLYLALAGAGHGDGRLRRMLADDVEWEDLRLLARRDGVTGELWRRLSAASAPVPEGTAQGWAREARVADFHLLRLEGRLGEVCRLLEESGVRPVLVKGAAMAYTAHGGMLRRPMSDVDLLVGADEVQAVRRLLEGAGWRATAPEAEYAGHHHLPPLTDPAGEGVLVELHHEIVGGSHPFAYTGDGVRGRAVEVGVPWGRALVPDPADRMLHLAVHFAWSHELRWGAWRAFADVAALLASADAGEWLPGLRGRAARAGMERVLGWTLRLAEEVGGVRLPDEAEEVVRRGAPGGRRLARHLAHQLVPGPGASPSVSLGRAAWELAVRPSGREASARRASRPWEAGRAAMGSGQGVGLAPLGRRLGRQLWRAGAWLGYLRALAGGGSGRGGRPGRRR